MTFLVISLCACTKLIGQVASEYITFEKYTRTEFLAEVKNPINNIAEARTQCAK